MCRIYPTEKNVLAENILDINTEFSHWSPSLDNVGGCGLIPLKLDLHRSEVLTTSGNLGGTAIFRPLKIFFKGLFLLYERKVVNERRIKKDTGIHT